MNRAQALDQAKQLFGAAAAVRDERKASSAAARAAAAARLSELRGIPVDKRTKAQREQLQQALGDALHFRYAVGRSCAGVDFAIFAIRGQGDSWEEALSNAKRECARAA